MVKMVPIALSDGDACRCCRLLPPLFERLYLVFFWLALGTLTFWVSM